MPRSRHLPTHTRSMSSWHMATKREQLIFFNCLNLVDLPRTSTLIWVNSFSYVQTPRVKPHSVVPKGQRHLLIKFETQLKAFFSLLIVETLWFFINLSHPTTQIGYCFFGTRKVIESNFHIVLVEKKKWEKHWLSNPQMSTLVHIFKLPELVFLRFEFISRSSIMSKIFC